MTTTSPISKLALTKYLDNQSLRLAMKLLLKLRSLPLL